MEACERQVVLVNKMGLHARPSTLIAGVAGNYEAEVEIVRDGMVVNAKSVLELLMLAAEHGTQLTIRARGNGARTVVHALIDLIESRFGELDVDQ